MDRADFPLPANFYELSPADALPTRYPFNHCNRDLDRRAAAATATLQTEPGEALGEWTEIDRDHDQAPLVPVTNASTGGSLT